MVASSQKMSRFKGLAVIAAAAGTVSLSAGQALSQSNDLIEIDGSSTVFPITEAISEEFMAQSDARVTVGVSGTGGGFERFCAGETDISNASRPIKETEVEACEAAGVDYVVIPVATDAITVVVSQDNEFLSELTVDQLQTLWEPAAEGTITRWNQLDPSFPNEEISLYGPGPDSGTFDYFTEEIVGEEDSSRGDYTASEDDNVLVLGAG
ncbi:substrate-binding domain-containing protein [Vasconcelosia minhoensis]|nr:substrate-binding domain-containing protein [Romeria gracilis]